MEAPHPAFYAVLAMAVGILAQSLARSLRVPGIVLLLGAGVALGPDVLGWVQPRALGDGLLAIVDLAVAVILFEGALNLEPSRLRREGAAIRRLVTWGALLTLFGAAVAVQALCGWSWMQSLLFGGLVSVTGPTVVGPLVRQLRLRQRLATVLEAEGVFVDPVGAILAVLLLEIAVAPDADSLAQQGTALLLRLGYGAALGALGGLGLATLLRRRLLPEGYANIFSLASVLLLFEGSNQLASHSGIVAVTVAGVVVGNLRSPMDRDLREFKDQLSVLLIGLLFVLLAADVRLADVEALGWPGLAVVGALVLVVRPVAVLVCTAGSEFKSAERVFMAWVAPRGIVAAAVASVTASTLEREGMQGGDALRALVFLTIAATVTLAGLTAAPLARLLRVRLPHRDVVAILGAQGLGMSLGSELREAGVPVLFLDSNPQNCRRAQEAGFNVVFGDALQERTMQRGRFETVDAAVGLTPNQTLNSVFTSRARERFEVPRAYIAAARPGSGLAPDLVERGEAAVLFEGPHDVERWDVRERHGDALREHWRFAGAPDEDAKLPAIGELFAILAVRREAGAFPMRAGLELREGDLAAVAVHAPERDKAHAVLRAHGFELEEGEVADEPVSR